MELDIEINFDDLPACAGCAGQPLLSARFPHSWLNSRGEEVIGVREVALCPQCDRGSRAADELQALFAVDEQVGLANAEAFAILIGAWLEEIGQNSTGSHRLEMEWEQWRQGDL
ncbi:DUF6300 family protein [Streptomyces virginiae]|uniref:DUF6300 family protein n=1 Tax=Streptomyces virginiae TaxID=1961 RepID=UPI002F910BCA|nr:DUF6300 family protein [Streptomyces virginiae]